MSEKGVEEKNPSSTNDSMLARIVAGIISILMLCVFFWIISSSNESLLTAVTGSHPRSFDLNFGPGILNTLLMTVVLILVFSVLLPYLACNYGKKNNTKVFDFFDKRWLPEKGKSKVVTKYNERLEMVAVSEYWSTTVWSMVTEKIPITLFLSLILTILGILPIIVRAGSVDSLVVTFFLSFYAVLVFMITLITFWVTEWKRTRDKVVVFTTFFIKTTVRTIYDVNIKIDGDFIKISVSGDGFLYNMVRIIVGTLINVGRGKITPEDIEKIILGRDRKAAGDCVPAKGLKLTEVYY